MTEKKDDAAKAGPKQAGAASGTPAGGTQSGGASAGGASAGGASAGGKPGSPAAGAGSDTAKRPHAIVEGKAVEISSTTIRPEPAKAEAGRADPARNATPDAKPDAKPDDKPGAKPAATAASTGKTAAASPPPPRRSSGLGSAITHLLAGVIGGATAWYGVTAIGPELGIVPPPLNGGATRVLEEKVAALERVTQARATAGPDLSGKLAAAESEIQKLQATAKSVADLNAAQAKVASDLRALTDGMAKQAEGSARVAKLEEQLKLLSDAAGDKDAGKLPQLAAVTGRLVDLETTLTNQLSAIRKTVAQELENRLALTNETSEAAKSGTNRVDRELSAVKSDTATIIQRLDTVKSESDRLAAKIAALGDETSTLKTGVEGLKADVEAKLKATAKPADVASAIAPIVGKIGALEQNLLTVVKSEDDRKANAERIVLSLELNNLKRVIDRGQKYGTELAEVRKIASAGKVDLAVLERYKDSGLPTLADLNREFPEVANVMLDTESQPAEGSVLERMLANAKSVVRVRKTNHAATDKSLEAVIGRMESALKDGRVGDVASESRTLPSKAAAAAQPFLLKLEARAAVDQAIATLETSLKSALAGRS